MSTTGRARTDGFRWNLIVLSVGFVILWNTGFIGAEFGLPYSGPLTMLFWRYLVLTVVLWPLVIARRELRRISLRQAGRVAIVGILAHGVWLACVLVAINQGVPAGIVALVTALQPLLTGALAGLFTEEHTSGRQWMGLLLGFSGVIIAVGARLAGSTPAPPGFYVLPFLSAAAITAANLIQRRAGLARTDAPISLGFQLAIQSTATTAALALPAVFLESLQTEWVPAYGAALVWLVFAVSFGAYALMWRILEKTSTTRFASLFFLGPPVTMLMAWAAFGDVFLPTDFAGLVVAGCGIILVTLQFRENSDGRLSRSTKGDTLDRREM
jgi:drug/metabolite transporter (DMT)-like permease